MFSVSGSGSSGFTPSTSSGGSSGSIFSGSSRATTGSARLGAYSAGPNYVNEPANGGDTFTFSGGASNGSGPTNLGGGPGKGLFKSFLDEIREFLNLMFPPVSSK